MKQSNLFTNATVNDIMDEVYVYNGNPMEGDRLGLLYRPGLVYTNTIQRDRNGRCKEALEIEMEYYLTLEQERAYKSAADRVLASLHLEGKSDYEKVRAIYNYICSHVTYDYAHLDTPDYLLQYTGYAALEYGTAVCSGVADLFYYLGNASGVETRIKTHTSHAWNFVKIDGVCYYLDATWDLGLPESQYRYFMKGMYDFECHDGGLIIDLTGFGNELTDTDRGYMFSKYAYGDPRNGWAA